ncbi:MAG: NACHT domain-containing protein, partial [Xenococcaceae cyanobacterium MO_167.B52]|nr:NACHT domain-containing protein [Xenococcaceae cyanobacterium MO_167.B52]
MKIVVEDALNIAQSISPPQEQLYLDFPQINSERLTARVIHWQPIESNDSGDIAVLELDSPLPTKAKPVHFVYRDNLWDYKFRAFGFLNDYDEGVWIDGSIREKGVGGWLQVESGTGFSLGEGCSGTAIWNEELQGVVGMAVVAETSPNIKVGFCIPSPLLHQAIPAILEEHYLNEFCANLERKKSLRAFVELSAQADINTQSKKMNSSKRHLSEEWGLGSEFSILEQSDNAGSETADNQIQKKTLNNISEATQEYESFVLLGEPGMGKTTTLYRIAYNAACKRLGDASHPLPLLLKLPSWTDQRTINEFIRANWPFADDPIHRLINGDILLCLDGLNEINQESQENKQKVESLSEWLRSDKSPKHIVITCRVRDYSKELKLDLPVVLMEKMNESHIRAFVTSYLGSDTEQFLDKILPSVNSNKKDNNRHLFQLAQNPYFLTAFIVFYTTERERDLPSTQGQLFEVLVRQLWKREKDLRNAEELPDIQVAKRILGNLAFNMIDKNHSTQAPFVEAMKQSSENCLQSETVWELSQDAGLVEVENGNIHFSHQLLRDYFAALKLAELESVSKISKPSLSQNIFGWRTEGEWDQAIKILCELYSEKAEHYINHILNNKNSYLAAECLTGGVIASDEIVAKVIIDLLKDISLISPAEVARSFSIGVIVGLPLSGVSLLVPSWLSKPVTKHITSPIFSKIWKSIDGYRNEIKCAYISDLLEQIGKPTLPALKQCIDSKNESIRIFAVNNIRKIGDDVTAIQYLSEVFPLSEKANVRLFIINELKKFKELEKFGDSSKIMNVFCDALLDSSSSVRLAAFKAFCRVGRKTAALPHLVSALQHHEPNVR